MQSNNDVLKRNKVKIKKEVSAVDSTTEIVNQCEQYSNFIAKAFCEGGTAMYFIAIVGFFVVGFDFRKDDYTAKIDSG